MRARYELDQRVPTLARLPAESAGRRFVPRLSGRLDPHREDVARRDRLGPDRPAHVP